VRRALGGGPDRLALARAACYPDLMREGASLGRALPSIGGCARRAGERRGRLSRGLRLAVLLGAWLAPSAARATVAEQRARLPPPAECEDPVEGIWRAHQFEANRGEWYIFTLEIHRVKAGAPELTGVVRSEYWNGTTKDQEAPACNSAGGYHFHHVVHMPGKGSLRDADVAFGGTSYTWEKDVCGTGHGGYNPDRFTGRIDPAIQEFQSVNNDGGQAVNVPTVFRRIHCFDEAGPPPQATVNVTPPRLFKPKARGGCQCAQIGSPQGDLPDRGIGTLALALAMGGVRRRSRRG
jgi:hypothetical protein